MPEQCIPPKFDSSPLFYRENMETLIQTKDAFSKNNCNKKVLTDQIIIQSRVITLRNTKMLEKFQNKYKPMQISRIKIINILSNCKSLTSSVKACPF